MGYADGFYYGQGRIICDTSTFSVGDTIRVRSVYNALQTEDKQVVTVGTPLIFTVPPYDYYKICRVQTINDTPTEIGGEYVEIGFGDLHRSNVVDKTTLAGIQGILNSHTENYALNIGDEVTIKINEGGTPTDWVMQIAGINVYNSHEVRFVSKHILSMTNRTSYDYTSDALRTIMQTFYNNIDSNDKRFIKEVTRVCRISNGGSSYSQKTYSDYCYTIGWKEVTGGSSSEISQQTQMPLFTSQANRIKTYNGTANNWCTADIYNTVYFANVLTNGTVDGTPLQTSTGVVPCFTLIADS